MCCDGGVEQWVSDNEWSSSGGMIYTLQRRWLQALSPRL